MKKFLVFIFVFLSLFPIFYFLSSTTAIAVCPVCTVAVIAGLGVSRALGIDDIVTSIWIGGLILSISFWFIDWMKKRWPKLKIQEECITSWARFKILTIIGIYLLVLIPLYFNHSIGLIYNKLWGIDKIILGITIGSAAFLSGMWTDKKIREVKGRQLFIYQKVVFPILALIITSLVFYLVTKTP